MSLNCVSQFQFALYRKLPWKYISRVYGILTACEMPLWLRSPCFRLYIWLFQCRLEEAAITDLRQYRSMSEFFRRSLRPGIRPVNSASSVVSYTFIVCTLFSVIAGCLQLLEILEIYLNLKTLLEILEISLNLLVLLEIFCVRWSTALVSSHKTGYQIAYLSRNWSPYCIFAMAQCCIKCISCNEHWLELIITCSIKCSRFGTLHSRPKQCKLVLNFSWNPSWSLLEISWKFVQLNL